MFSNGSLLVATDQHLNIRELFYPHVGQFDHLGGQMIRMGVWANEKFAWMDEAGWKFQLGCRPDSLVSDCLATNENLGIRLRVKDCVLPDRPAFFRSMEVTNLGESPLDVRIFLNQDIKIAESDTGLTAFYHPESHAMIHFKGQHAFLFAAVSQSPNLRASKLSKLPRLEGELAWANEWLENLRRDGILTGFPEGFFQYATGVRRYGGERGTWKDAEKGELNMLPISQGAVDSTLGIRALLQVRETKETSYWIVAGGSIQEVSDVWSGIRASVTASGRRATNPEPNAEAAFESDASALTGIQGRFDGLPDDIQAFCRQSYLILKTQVDHEGGILAANDSSIMIDNRAHYSYVWPRDGSLVAQVLDRLGDHDASARYFNFCSRLWTAGQGCFLQKYQPDGAFGATWHPWVTPEGPEIPVQIDETALTVIALRDHLATTGSLLAGQKRWQPLMDQMIGGLLGRIDPETGLPTPGYDLWEERRGIHAFTTATVVFALEAAGDVYNTWKTPAPGRLHEAAGKMRKEFVGRFFDPKGVCYRMLEPDLRPDPTPDASLLLIGLIGVLPITDPRIQKTQRWLLKKLSVKSAIGGIARYPGDWYWRQGEQYPGNPWVICTMWLAQCQIALAQKRSDLHEPLEWLRWAKRLAGATGVLAEQYHPETGEPLSVSPLTWSHSEVLRTALDWCARRAQLAE